MRGRLGCRLTHTQRGREGSRSSDSSVRRPRAPDATPRYVLSLSLSLSLDGVGVGLTRVVGGKGQSRAAGGLPAGAGRGGLRAGSLVRSRTRLVSSCVRASPRKKEGSRRSDQVGSVCRDELPRKSRKKAPISRRMDDEKCRARRVVLLLVPSLIYPSFLFSSAGRAASNFLGRRHGETLGQNNARRHSFIPT